MTSSSPQTDPVRIAVIGAGPAGLMAAEVLTDAGHTVDIYDAMPSVGRKFLMAGKSGLNITHTEGLDLFVGRYAGQDSRVPNMVRDFTPHNVIRWMAELGIEARTGSTGRVFPTMMKASPLLRAWVARLQEKGAVIHTRHRWQGWDENGALKLQGPDGPMTVTPAATVFSLGGGSWKRLGSDGAWADHFRERHVSLSAFEASNGGFMVDWTEHMKREFAGAPVKGIRLTAHGEDGPVSTRSEFVITERGVESGGIYTLSAPLRQALAAQGAATLTIDLLPDVDESALVTRLSRPRGKESVSNYLRKAARLTGVKKALLYECTPREVLADPAALAKAIKALPLNIIGTAPLDEAISTAGGVRLEALTEDLMLRDMPGTFCAGEMLDWDAPTGGYLITACLATGRRAGQGVAAWLLDKDATTGQG